MRKIFTLSLCTLLLSVMNAQTICDPGGNVVIYSNYDGGPLTINVDQNISNLKIGILSYEFCRITVTGTYAANVTQLWYVGFDANNDHCSLGAPLNTTITGVPNNVDSILLYPTATYSNPNGNNSMICNYTCSTTTNQGGCNTADQTAHYFLTQFGGSLRFHFTQYGCWADTMSISAGGNCCANPLTSIAESNDEVISLSPNPATDNIALTTPSVNEVRCAEIVNILGEVVQTVTIAPGTTSQQISLENLAAGTYFFRMDINAELVTTKIIIVE